EPLEQRAGLGCRFPRRGAGGGAVCRARRGAPRHPTRGAGGRQGIEPAADVAGLAAGLDPLAEVADDQPVAAVARRGEGEHLPDLLALAGLGGRIDLLAGTLAEALERQHIGPRIKKNAVARQPVAAGAADFLVVTLDRARHVAVDDIA